MHPKGYELRKAIYESGKLKIWPMNENSREEVNLIMQAFKRNHPAK
jgi:hypothetical protein